MKQEKYEEGKRREPQGVAERTRERKVKVEKLKEKVKISMERNRSAKFLGFNLVFVEKNHFHFGVWETEI